MAQEANRSGQEADRPGREVRRPGRLVAPVGEGQAAEYVFELVRSLVAITREYREFRLTTYFLEMAALEVAPLMKSNGAAKPVRSPAARPADRADG